MTGFDNQRSVILDHSSHGLKLVNQLSLLLLFAGNQVHQVFESAGSVSFDWSTEFRWRWNQSTSEDLVEVVNGLSWSDSGDLSDNLSGSDELLVDLSDQSGLVLNLVGQDTDLSGDLGDLLLDNVQLLNEWSNNLLHDWDLSWSWWLDNEFCWRSSDHGDVSGSSLDNSSDLSDFVSDLSDSLSEDSHLLLKWWSLFDWSSLDLLNQFDDLSSDNSDLLGQLHDLLDLLDDSVLDLLDLLSDWSWVDARQSWSHELLDLSSDEAHWSVALILKSGGISAVSLKLVTSGVKLVSLRNQLSNLSLLFLGLSTSEDWLEDSSFLDSDLLESLSGDMDNLSDLLDSLDQFLDRSLQDNNSLLSGLLNLSVLSSLNSLDKSDNLSSDDLDLTSDSVNLLNVDLDDLLLLDDLSLLLLSVNTNWLLNDLSDLSSDNSDSLSDGDDLLGDLLDALSQLNNLLSDNWLLGWLNLNSTNQVSDSSSDDSLLSGQLGDFLSELGNSLSEFDNLLDLWLRMETQLTWLLDDVASVDKSLVLGAALSFLLEDQVIFGLEGVQVGKGIGVIWVGLTL